MIVPLSDYIAFLGITIVLLIFKIKMLLQLQCFCIVWIFYCTMKKNDCKSLKMLNFSFKYFTRKTLLRYIFFSWVPWWASQKGDAMYIVLQSKTFKFHKTKRRLSVLSGTLTSDLIVTSQPKVLLPPRRQKKWLFWNS